MIKSWLGFGAATYIDIFPRGFSTLLNVNKARRYIIGIPCFDSAENQSKYVNTDDILLILIIHINDEFQTFSRFGINISNQLNNKIHYLQNFTPYINLKIDI